MILSAPEHQEGRRHGPTELAAAAAKAFVSDMLVNCRYLELYVDAAMRGPFFLQLMPRPKRLDESIAARIACSQPIHKQIHQGNSDSRVEEVANSHKFLGRFER